MKRQEVTESPAARWTRPEDYLGAFARKRSFRRGRRPSQRTEPESPRLFLSLGPVGARRGRGAVLAVSTWVAACPGTHPAATPPPPAQKEQGVAAKGWFQEAEKDFRH